MTPSYNSMISRWRVLEAALRSSNDETDESGGNPLDQNYETANIDYSALVRLMENCKRFQASPPWQAALAEDDPRTDRRQGYGCNVSKAPDMISGLRVAGMARVFGMVTGRAARIGPRCAFEAIRQRRFVRWR